MGDLFNARRAAAIKRRQETVIDTTTPPSTTTTTAATIAATTEAAPTGFLPKRPSFLDIQQEQAAEDRKSRDVGSNFRDNHHRGGNSHHQEGSTNRSFSSNSDSRGGSGSRRSDRGFRQNNNNSHTLPREEGVIASLLESFGFIKCAQRNEEVFFHYSELTRELDPSMLEIGQEVEFDIGHSPKSDKLAAYRVKTLPRGTVQWEIPDLDGQRTRGKVDRSARASNNSNQDGRGSNSNSSNFEGTIILLSTAGKAEADTAPPHEGETTMSVKFTASEYSPESRESSRLGKGDLVEFTIVTERRTGKKLAKHIVLIQSERERSRLLREEMMLKEATQEQGVVLSLQEEGGFLRSTSRRSPIYFQYSHVDLKEKGNEDNQSTLKEGQDMKFLVCKEAPSSGRNREQQFSAREITFLPKGSVKFHHPIATGLEGVISTIPVPSSNKKGNSAFPSQHVPLSGGEPGKVCLKEPLVLENNETVSEVLLYAEDCPGGIFAANRDGSQVGLWIKVGDSILFDLVKEVIDGSYRVVGTTDLVPKVKQESSDAKASVRLIETALATKTYGCISAIKEGFGFINCVERNVDVYFRLYEVFPPQLQLDLARNMVLDEKERTSELPPGLVEKLSLGTPVSFDLSCAAPVSHSNNRRGKPSENLKGLRVAILPEGILSMDKVLVESARGIVSQEHNDGSGFIELETPVKPMSHDDRHPLVSRLLNSILSTGESITYPCVQSTCEAQVIMSMAEGKGLNVNFVGGMTDVASPDPAVNGYARLMISAPSSKDHVVPTIEKSKTMDQEHATAQSVEGVATPQATSMDSSPKATETTTPRKSGRKRTAKKSKPVKAVRFERGSMSRDNKGGPPCLGDVLVCNVIQSYKTGVSTAVCVKVMERKMVERKAVSAENNVDSGTSAMKHTGTSGLGLVMEVVPSRNFGFISLLDESAVKRESLFFHMSSVIMHDADTETKGDDTPGKSGRRSKGRYNEHGAVLIKKGDEVKFDIGKHDKNGKRVALNIVVLPYGTLQIPSNPDKNACKGFILLEPSHTVLSSVGSHSTNVSATSSKSPGGRWSQDPRVHRHQSSFGSNNLSEEGLILLISDPSGQFSNRHTKNRSPTLENLSTKVSELSTGSENNTPPTSESQDSTKAGFEEEGNITSTPKKESSLIDTSSTLIRVKFRNGSVAMRGAGSSSSTDTSTAPRRGDLVSFMKGKGSGGAVKDIRVEKRSSAEKRRGHLENILIESGTAEFVVEGEGKNECITFDLNEIVSCEVKQLKQNTAVEGILYEGSIYGVCRVTDLYLETKVGGGKKERPRLNLTVKKELRYMGGKIVAQSGLAKGPDGTIGFKSGWTNRVSRFADKTDGGDGDNDAPDG